MDKGKGDKLRLFRRAMMAILVLILVFLIACFGYLLRDFQQSLHDLPH